MSVFEQFDHRAVEGLDRGLKDAEESGSAEGPAVLEERVVLLLDADAGEAAETHRAIGLLVNWMRSTCWGRCCWAITVWRAASGVASSTS